MEPGHVPQRTAVTKGIRRPPTGGSRVWRLGWRLGLLIPAQRKTVLIETSAIRIHRNSQRITNIHFSNRDKIDVWAALQIPCFLIATPAIKNATNLPRINYIHSSNRHKGAGFAGSTSGAPAPSKLRFLTSNFPFLIGPPVIRIRPKPFRISANYGSNRHKTWSALPRHPSAATCGATNCARRPGFSQHRCHAGLLR